VLLKVAHYDPYASESVEKYDTFKRELYFHQDLLPQIRELLLSIGDKTKFTDE